MTRAESKLAGTPGAETVTRSQLAERWGVTRQAVSKLFKQPGAPVFVNGKIELADAERWHDSRRVIARPSDAARAIGVPEMSLPDDAEVDEAVRFLKLRQAQLVDLEFRTKKGDLIARADVEQIARADMAVIKSALLSLGQRLAPAIVDLPSPDIVAVAAVITSAVRDMLAAWSEGLSGEHHRRAAKESKK